MGTSSRVVGLLLLAGGAAVAQSQKGARDAGTRPPAATKTLSQQAPAVERSLPKPDYLSELARSVLRKRMERHGQDQMELVLSVTLLNRDRVKELATNIANEPRLVRPIAGGDDDVNAALPERFFVLQDELRSRAKGLAQSATQGNDAALASEFGHLVETCVACHSTYLKP